ncbi:hypothetical protein [Natrinema altunense]|nr:hypothetical protein [Natrinema altunense]
MTTPVGVTNVATGSPSPTGRRRVAVDAGALEAAADGGDADER